MSAVSEGPTDRKRARRRELWPLAGLVLLVLAGGARGEDWPQFRGPNRDGVSGERGVLTAWPAGGPPAVWRAPLGEGYSGIVAVGDRLFTMYSDREGEYVTSLLAATGRTAWRVRVDSPFHNSFGNGPRSTPTVEGGRVFALGAQGQLVSLDAGTGRRLWGRDLKRDFGAQPPTWGVSASPHVEGDLLLVDTGGRSGYGILAFDKASGEVVWHSQSDQAGYSTPVSVAVGAQRQVLFLTGTQIVGLSPQDGALLWRQPWRTSYDVNAATPIFVPPDRVFVSTGYDTGAALFRIRPQGAAAEVLEVWRNRDMKNQFSSSVYHGGFLYGFDNSTLKCLDASTGQERWRARGFGHGSLLYADGHLLVLSDRGTLALVEASPEAYRETARAQVLEGKTWTVPTLAGGRLYLRNEREIVALDLRR